MIILSLYYVLRFVCLGKIGIEKLLELRIVQKRCVKAINLVIVSNQKLFKIPEHSQVRFGMELIARIFFVVEGAAGGLLQVFLNFLSLNYISTNCFSLESFSSGFGVHNLFKI